MKSFSVGPASRRRTMDELRGELQKSRGPTGTPGAAVSMNIRDAAKRAGQASGRDSSSRIEGIDADVMAVAGQFMKSSVKDQIIETDGEAKVVTAGDKRFVQFLHQESIEVYLALTRLS